MSLLIFYLVLAIGVSFMCSILEAVLLSITPSYVAVMENSNSASGKLLRKMKQDIDQPLSAILSLNTVAHTVGAAGVGAQAQVVFGNAYVSITSAILTLLILVLSEIIPKTLGATYWKNLAVVSAKITRVLIIVTYPLVVLSKWITKWLSSEDNQPSVSREEIGAMAEIGFEEGVFEEGESNIFKNLIRFNSLKVHDIMTPRIVVVKFQQDVTIKEVLDNKEELRVSRMPIYGENEEDITGYILKNDLYLNLSQGKGDKTLKDIRREVLIIPEVISLKNVLEKLLENQEHIAVVVDEYGGLAGVVTMEDVVETLLGMEIVDEIDVIEDMQKLAKEQWKNRAKSLGIVMSKSASKDQSEKKSSKEDQKRDE